MKPLRSLLLLASTPLVLASRPADSLAYAPREGLVLQRTLTMESELSLDDMTMEVDGNDLSQMTAGMEMALKVVSKIDLTDTYGAVADGHPARIERSFDEISSSTHVSSTNPMTGSTENSVDLVSDLDGLTVVFSRGADGDYAAAYAEEGAGDADLLEGLAADLDLEDALPGREVAAEDTWELPGSFLRQILLPAGDLSLHAEEGPASEFDVSISDIIENIKGGVTASYGGTRTEDGVQVAVIRLALRASSARDMTEKSEQMLEQMRQNMPPGAEVELQAFDVELDYDLEGELYWNLEAGLPHALQMSGEVSQVLDISMSLGNADERHAIVQSMSLGGSLELSMTVTR